MTYDIPPELKHKEKIMFGLTFSQLAYAFPTFLIIFFIVLKSSLSLELSLGLSFPFVALAVFFMFFDGKNKTLNLIKHLRNQEVEVNSEKLKEIINIKKIQHNIVETSKSKLSILEVVPLNFMIRTEEEKETIINGFQKFLNSLDFPIQIHINSTPINLRKHLKHLASKNIDPQLFDNYCKFIKNTLKENNVQNRTF